MTFEDPLIAGIRGITVLTSAAIVAGLVVLDIVLRVVLRRRARAVEATAPAGGSGGEATRRSLLGGALRRLAGPLALVLWTQGLFVALAGPLGEWPQGDLAPKLLAALQWLRGGLMLVAAVWLLGRLGRLIEHALTRHATRSERGWDDVLAPVIGSAVRLTLPLLAIILAAPALEISPELRSVLQQAISMALIGVLVYLLLRLVDAGADLVLSRHPLTVADNIQARGIYTQVTVLRKLAVSVITIFGIASMLMVFDTVRQLGTTILASAGVAGIIIGFAAQKTLGALLAGFQIAMTQPIRVDDVVIVEGEWGRIEEITLTYVVVAIWDQRRLVVPITYFIEKPFQNWTRTGSQILGTVMLYTDYAIPVDAVRAELDRLLQTTQLWDRRVGILQVTESKESTLELRVLVSAQDAGIAFDLRCYLREHLVAWLQREHPDALPRLRVEAVRTPDGMRSATPLT
jgi:small-conductance mechanosensitive channel